MPNKIQLHTQPRSNAAQAIHSILSAAITANGPISVGRFMDIALGSPTHGYYHRQDPFGAVGDFTTAAEISGLFGEMCGLYLAHMFEHAGQPAGANIVELGPGRGSLMADMRHVWSHIMPQFSKLPVHLVETSPVLRQIQHQSIGKASVSWHNDAYSLPNTALFGVANEFFDALPIQQAIFRHGGWRHRLIGIKFGELTFVDGQNLDRNEQSAWPIGESCNVPLDGDVAEYCPAAIAITTQISQRIAKNGGAFLIIDYGQNGNIGDSLQAVAAHKPVHIFHKPGDVDISHWVDFTALKKAADNAGARFIGPVMQKHFLMSVGLPERAENAALHCDTDNRRALFAAVDRLVSSHHMGAAFKAGLILPAGSGTPPGFEIGDTE